MNNRYIVVKKLKNGSKMNQNSKFYVQDILFIVVMVFLGFMFENLVYDKLFIPFMIFNLVVGIMLVFPSKTNPGKKNYQAVHLAFISTQDFFSPVKNLGQKEKNRISAERLNK